MGSAWEARWCARSAAAPWIAASLPERTHGHGQEQRGAFLAGQIAAVEDRADEAGLFPDTIKQIADEACDWPCRAFAPPGGAS